MSFLNKFVVLFFCCLFVFSFKLQAQEQLALKKAVELCLENNFDIRIENARVEIAENNNSWETAGRWPSLSLIGTNNNSLSDIDNPASFLNGQLSNYSFAGGLDVNWNVFSGFKVKITKSQLALLEAQSLGNASIVVENSLQALILGFYEVLYEEANLQVLAKNLELSRDRYTYIKTKKELGSATTFDLLQIKNAWMTDSSIYLLQILNNENAVRNLNLIMGVEVNQNWEIVGNLEDQPGEWLLEDLKSKMFSSNRTLKNQYINLEILQKNVGLSQAFKYPTLSLNLGTSYTTNIFKLDDNPSITGKTFSYYGNFMLGFNIYNGGQVKRNIENARVNEKIGMLGIDQMKLSMNNQLVVSFEMLSTRLKLLSITETNLTDSELNLELAKAKFRNGTINSFDYRDIQVQNLRASIARQLELFRIKENQTQLLRITGGILSIISE